MSRGPDAATLLERALLASAVTANCPVRVCESDWTRWASATFTGARHMLKLAATPGDALSRWLAALPEAEFALRGHLLADLTIERLVRNDEEAFVFLEVLTVEER
ncbi:hypothetical protein [Sphingosinithalassobacter sp. LHW66-3]|uniref:hypothetical protein n=1 Tax=Sphingosinithalassobacter sp. LHW66-3 TaxID=3424718 RepID=UPI003D6B7821